jgi:hypothetical protein
LAASLLNANCVLFFMPHSMAFQPIKLIGHQPAGCGDSTRDIRKVIGLADAAMEEADDRHCRSLRARRERPCSRRRRARLSVPAVR